MHEAVNAHIALLDDLQVVGIADLNTAAIGLGIGVVSEGAGTNEQQERKAYGKGCTHACFTCQLFAK